jgi:hypothetical protein
MREIERLRGKVARDLCTISSLRHEIEKRDKALRKLCAHFGDFSCTCGYSYRDHLKGNGGPRCALNKLLKKAALLEGK